jgi:hypothetical protein
MPSIRHSCSARFLTSEQPWRGRERSCPFLARTTGTGQQPSRRPGSPGVSGAYDLAEHLVGEPAALAQGGAVMADSGAGCRGYRHRCYLALSADYAEEQLMPGGSTWPLLLLAALLNGHGMPAASGCSAPSTTTRCWRRARQPTRCAARGGFSTAGTACSARSTGSPARTWPAPPTGASPPPPRGRRSRPRSSPASRTPAGTRGAAASPAPGHPRQSWQLSSHGRTHPPSAPRHGGSTTRRHATLESRANSSTPRRG